MSRPRPLVALRERRHDEALRSFKYFIKPNKRRISGSLSFNSPTSGRPCNRSPTSVASKDAAAPAPKRHPARPGVKLETGGPCAGRGVLAYSGTVTSAGTGTGTGTGGLGLTSAPSKGRAGGLVAWILVASVCLNQAFQCSGLVVSTAEASAAGAEKKIKRSTFAPSRSASTATKATRLVRLSGQRAQLECQLTPAVVAAGGVPTAAPSSARLAAAAELVGRPGSEGGQEAVIDEAPARADTPEVLGAPRGDDDESGGRRAAGRRQWARSNGREMDPENEGEGSWQEPAREQLPGGLPEPLDPDDSVELVLWYHVGPGSGASVRPIYSVDARSSLPLAQLQASGNGSQEERQVNWSKSSSSSSSSSSWSAGERSWRRQQQQGAVDPDSFVAVPREQDEESADEELDARQRLNSISGQERPGQFNYSSGQGRGAGAGAGGGERLDQQREEGNNFLFDQLLGGVASRAAKHNAVARLSGRVSLRISRRKARAYLIIERLQASDAGQYKCRVDFRQARTRYQLSELQVISPITQLRMKSSQPLARIDLWPRPRPDAGGASSASRRANESAQLSTSELLEANALWAQLQGQLRGLRANGSVNYGQSSSVAWDEDSGGSTGAASSASLAEVSEDETLELECNAADGWPSAQVAWWRLTWPPASERPRVTQLSTGLSLVRLHESLASVALELADEATNRAAAYRGSGGGGANEGRTSDLINANTMANSGNKQTNNGSKHAPNEWTKRPPVHVRGEQQSFAKSPPLSPGVVEYSANWLTGQLMAALDLPNGKAHQEPAHHLDLEAKVEAEEEEEEEEPQELTKLLRVWQIWRQKRPLVLYTCGASNAMEAQKVLMAQHEAIAGGAKGNNTNKSSSSVAQAPTGDVGSQHGDKLATASIRPLFRSILVQPSARPHLVRMYLVSRRQAGANSVPASPPTLIELAPLDEGQDVHLNLQASGVDDGAGGQEHQQSLIVNEERQLQLACQVSGSLPEARLEWHQRDGGRGASDDHDDEEASAPIWRQIAPESRGETEQLIRLAQASGKIQLAPGKQQRNGSVEPVDLPSRKFTTTEDLMNAAWIQWSSIRVRQLGVLDHRSVITCSAFNEHLALSLPASPSIGQNGKSSGGSQPNYASLSTSIRLNITHVPLVELGVEEKVSVEIGRRGQLHDRPLSLPSKASSNVSPSGELGPPGGPGRKFASHHSVALSERQRGEKLRGGESESEIKPVVFGSNVTFVCNVTFANPPLLDGIEWRIQASNNNDNLNHASTFEPLDKVTRLVQVQGKIQTSNRYRFVEKLIVQFTGSEGKMGSSELLWMKLNCGARNAFGATKSNTLALVAGRAPHCPSAVGQHSEHGSGGQRQQQQQQQTSIAMLVNTKANDDDDNKWKRSEVGGEGGSSKGDNYHNNYNNHNNNLTDKNPSEFLVHCPVISDKASATYYWLPSWPQVSHSKQHQHLSTSDSPLIPLWKLNAAGTSASTSSNGVVGEMAAGQLPPAAISRHEGGTMVLACYASDKFGSNYLSPCMIRLASADSQAGPGAKGTSNSPASNCAANLVARPTRSSGERQTVPNNPGDSSETQAPEAPPDGQERPKKLLLAIECGRDFVAGKLIAGRGKKAPESETSESVGAKHNDEMVQLLGDAEGVALSSGASSELVHFDLYHKRDTRFVKHLTSYAKDNESAPAPGSNLSLELELGMELESLPLEDIEEQHVVVMSVTDANNRLKRPNVTLYLNTNQRRQANNQLNQYKTIDGLSDKLSDMEAAGQPERVWVIGSLSVLFTSSIMLVILALVCKISHGSMRRNSGRGADTGNKSNGHSNNNTKGNKKSINHSAKPTQGLNIRQDSTTTTRGIDGRSEGAHEYYHAAMPLSCERNSQQQQQVEVTGELSEQRETTEMYLVGGRERAPRLAVYHNHSPSNGQLQAKPWLFKGCRASRSAAGVVGNSGKQELLLVDSHECNSSTMRESTLTTATNPYDFLIIHAAADASTGPPNNRIENTVCCEQERAQQPAYLLIEEPERANLNKVASSGSNNGLHQAPAECSPLCRAYSGAGGQCPFAGNGHLSPHRPAATFLLAADDEPELESATAYAAASKSARVRLGESSMIHLGGPMVVNSGQEEEVDAGELQAQHQASQGDCEQELEAEEGNDGEGGAIFRSLYSNKKKQRTMSAGSGSCNQPLISTCHLFEQQRVKDNINNNNNNNQATHLLQALVPLGGEFEQPAGYNFDLNSQGELTMTDESSSFVHDSADQTNNNGQAICRQCRQLQEANNKSGQQVAVPHNNYQQRAQQSNQQAPGSSPSDTSTPPFELCPAHALDVRLQLQSNDSNEPRPYYSISSSVSQQSIGRVNQNKRPRARGDGHRRTGDRVRFLGADCYLFDEND